ncbi:hypothetical protein GOP47_0028688 [Adiantum capillus-veneris]|nr:hypothetical protein GOP47_0028688 [Adiantum capillus-veneris]
MALLAHQQLLRHNGLFFSILPRFNLPSRQSSHCATTARHVDQQQQQQPAASPRLSSTPAPPDHLHHHPPAPADSPHTLPLCSNAKRIHIVDCSSEREGVYALRLRSPRDFRRMLATSGLLCLVPAQQDTATKAWRISGDGTRCFSDLRENTFYMAMSALRRNRSSHNSASASEQQSLASLRATVNQVRRELTNRALGEEGELTEALLRIFCKKAGFPGMVSKPQLRIVDNEEVDAVLVSPRAMAIGFHCNKLTHKEAKAALKRVSSWVQLASTGSSAHSFLLGKDVYVVLSGNLLPTKEYERVVSYCQEHRLMLLLKNGINFSLHNSLLPPQQYMVPAKLRTTSTTPQQC